MRFSGAFRDSSSVGRAAASQAAGRGFEPRLSLKKRNNATFFVAFSIPKPKKYIEK